MTKLTFLFCLVGPIIFAQNPQRAKELVRDGVKMHDLNQFEDALKLYEEALKADHDNFYALSEMGITYTALKEHQKAIHYSALAIKKHPQEDLTNTYVVLANNYDMSGNPKKALSTYNAALKKYPNYYHLHYNKAVTLINLGQKDESYQSFKKSASLNLNHVGSINALVVLSANENIPTILNLSRYLLLDNRSKRAQEYYMHLVKKISFNVKKDGPNSINISFNPASLTEKKSKEDNFASTELLTSMRIATKMTDSTFVDDEMHILTQNFTALFETLKDGASSEKGFYWEVMTPFFIELLDKSYVELFTYWVCAPSQKEEVLKFIEDNEERYGAFMFWMKKYRPQLVR